MNENNLRKLLDGHNPVEVDTYVAYIKLLGWQKNSKGQRTAEFIDKRSDEQIASYFKKVNAEGLALDGKHITLTSRGITMDYVALKNKLLLTYPESVIDLQLVYKGDEFTFTKDSGVIKYQHKILNPFNVQGRVDDNIEGAYCIIKNSRGEFLTTVNKTEIQKARAKATSGNVWKDWFGKMVLKTVIRDACKLMLDDVVGGLLDEDDKANIDLELPVGLNPEIRVEIESCKTLKELTEVYKEHGGKDGVRTMLTKRRKEIENADS